MRFVTLWRKEPPDQLEWDFYTTDSLQQAEEIVTRLKERGVHQYSTYQLADKQPQLSSAY